MDAMKNTDPSGGTRFSEGKGPMVGAPLFGLYQADLWNLYARWALDPRDKLRQGNLIGTLRNLVIILLEEPPAQAVGRVARVGAEKYALMDWTQGQLLSTLVNSAGRHIEKHILGRMADKRSVPTDTETGQPHIAMALWNVLCWTSLEQMQQGDRLDDYTHLRDKTTAQVREAECCGVGCLDCPMRDHE